MILLKMFTLLAVAFRAKCQHQQVVMTEPTSNVTLSCNFTSYQNMSPASNLLWQFNKQVIYTGLFTPRSYGLDNVEVSIYSDVSYLVIVNASSSNQGNYTCVVKTYVIRAYVLQVKGITNSSIERAAGLGTTVSLNCRGEGTHIWKFNDVDIMNSGLQDNLHNVDLEIINNTFSQLRIANISLENDGEFSCVIPEVTDFIYTLRVQDIHLHITINGVNGSTIQYLLSHVKYNVTCAVSKDAGEHSQSIKLRSFSLPEAFSSDDHLIHHTNGSNHVTITDAIFYTNSLQAKFLCSAVDDFGNEFAQTAVLMDVFVVPTLTIQRDDMNISDRYQVHIGEILILNCVALGSRPSVELRWKKGEENLTSSETIRKPNSFQSSIYDFETQLKLMATENMELTCYSSGSSKFHQLEATIFVIINTEESLKLLLVVFGGVFIIAVFLLFIAFTKLRKQCQRRENAELLALSLWQENTLSSFKRDPRKSVKSFRISGNVSRMERAIDSGFPSTESAISCQLVTLVSPVHCGDSIDYWLGRYSSNNGDTDCICETVSEKALIKDGYNFLGLAKSLRYLPCHTNIVSFLGSSTDEVPYYIYREYVTNNSLRDYLSQSLKLQQCSEASGDPSSTDITNKKYQRKMLSTDIADAMDFLHIQQFHHPALSAKKVLLSNTLIPKLFDFWPEELSASRAATLMKSLDPPTAWLAPETIFQDKYGKSSDIWAYGVLLWEIFSSGEIPFHGKQPKQIEEEIRDMKLLPQPKNCSRASFDIILSTWGKNPEQRPSFAELKQQIDSLPESFTEIEDEE